MIESWKQTIMDIDSGRNCNDDCKEPKVSSMIRKMGRHRENCDGIGGAEKKWKHLQKATNLYKVWLRRPRCLRGCTNDTSPWLTWLYKAQAMDACLLVPKIQISSKTTLPPDRLFLILAQLQDLEGIVGFIPCHRLHPLVFPSMTQPLTRELKNKQIVRLCPRW